MPICRPNMKLYKRNTKCACRAPRLAEPDIRRIDPEQSDMHPTGVPFHCFTDHACPPSSLLGRSTTLRLKFGTVS